MAADLVCVARHSSGEGRATEVSDDDRETSQDGEQWMQVSRCAKLSSGKVMRLVAAPPSLSLLTTPWGQQPSEILSSTTNDAE